MRAIVIATIVLLGGCLPLPTKKNPEHCLNLDAACAAGTECNPVSGRCEPIDMGLDGGADR